MLGKLARWLRMLGYDTAYERNINDADIAERVLKEDRWLLTRDRYLVARKALRDRFSLIHSDVVIEQLRQVQHDLQIKLIIDDDTVCRGAACNHPLERITPQEVAPRVPDFVARHYTEFASCPHCTRVYWPGTHWEHFQNQLHHLRLHLPM